MAEAVTYADLRFVKAPLKKSISSQLGQVSEADEDGELTYENVQVPSISGGALSLASSGLGDKTGVHSELPTASWSSVTSPAARRLLECPSACSKYLLLGLLLTGLLLGMVAISLGVRYLQVSQQLQHTNRVLEATNSSLRQQLHQRITQIGQREQDLQGSRRELAQIQEALQVERRDCQAVKEKLQACQSDREKAQENLQREEEQRRTLEQRLNRMQDTLKPFFTCPSPDTCCPVGWILNERSCFYVSLTKRTWENSQDYCKSLSSNLATVRDVSYSGYYNYYSSSLTNMLEKNGWTDSYWITFNAKEWHLTESTKISRCLKVQTTWRKKRELQWESDCSFHLSCICEMAAFKYPDGDHSALSRILMPTRARAPHP
ncbi:PREDICTED: B-cell differentiation antigen CD72 isoform X2 [Hipposideros armiger]|uniref:B-cell differentiation antigen CD72 isoform X2 n=1 Tax=Hipposideros armiger TaxID=186990 RepID=A0A8B7T1G4_HIPAR|nr:PREDICTED: B-cell differentiation antigen CD72 isoform X2 [Hipposideros armiger]